MSSLKFSIITVVFNNERTIQDTVKSIAMQTYPNFEYLVIDGQSTDATLTRLRECGDAVTRLVSEPDQGIYDAMNKGIALASGDIVGTLNADDFYAHENVLNEVAQAFLDPSIEACYGDLLYVSEQKTDKIVRYWKSRDYTSELFKSGWMPAHPTFFVRKSVYQRLGVFDLNYKIASDFELLFRFVEQHKIKTKYLPKVLVKMRLGGTTNKNLSNILAQNKEIIVILKKYYPDFSAVKFVFSKLINRYFQFISHPEN